MNQKEKSVARVSNEDSILKLVGESLKYRILTGRVHWPQFMSKDLPRSQGKEGRTGQVGHGHGVSKTLINKMTLQKITNPNELSKHQRDFVHTAPSTYSP